jgi:hypothetical protein
MVAWEANHSPSDQDMATSGLGVTGVFGVAFGFGGGSALRPNASRMNGVSNPAGASCRKDESSRLPSVLFRSLAHRSSCTRGGELLAGQSGLPARCALKTNM